MRDIPDSDKPGFVAEKPEHSHAYLLDNQASRSLLDS